jgi:lipopolysaccharide export system protein LptC
MSLQAEQQHTARMRWALPGGRHDRLVRLLKTLLPMAVGVTAAVLATAPFAGDSEVSFVLDKNGVDVASERMRVREALYRGEDSKGRPFSLRAGSAVQKTSRDPVVMMQDLSARLLMADGPAVLTAQTGRYNLDTERVGIVGPVQFESAGGYRLTTRDVGIDLKTRRMRSAGQVDGRMPIGTYRADRLAADLDRRIVVLEGHARLRIEQNAIKGQGR